MGVRISEIGFLSEEKAFAHVLLPHRAPALETFAHIQEFKHSPNLIHSPTKSHHKSLMSEGSDPYYELIY